MTITRIKEQDPSLVHQKRQQAVNYQIKRISNSLEDTLSAIQQSRNELDHKISIVNSAMKIDQDGKSIDLKEKLIQLLRDKFDGKSNVRTEMRPG